MIGSFFVAARRTNDRGYTWTLATRLGDALSDAERRFGPRDKSWTILGIEIGPGNPHTWFPEPAAVKQVVIQLSAEALTWKNEAQAIFQIAHECVHLLSPDGTAAANVFEEGIASAFAEDWVLQATGVRLTYSATNAYSIACRQARELLAIDPDAVRKLREVEPSFMKMTRDTFVAAGLQVPDELIAELLEPFERVVHA